MYCEELLKEYPKWLAKKMEPGINKLIKKGTKQKRESEDGSDSEYGPAPYAHEREICAYPRVWGYLLER